MSFINNKMNSYQSEMAAVLAEFGAIQADLNQYAEKSSQKLEKAIGTASQIQLRQQHKINEAAEIVDAAEQQYDVSSKWVQF